MANPIREALNIGRSLVRGVGEAAGAKPFYSNVDQAIAAITQTKGTGEQMLAQLLKSKGVAKELKDRPAVKAALEQAKTQKMTKQDLEKLAADNPPPQIFERVDKGPSSGRYEIDYNKNTDRYEVLDDSGDASKSFHDYEDAEDYVKKLYEGTTRFDDYQLGGGQNYREIKIMLPKREGVEDFYKKEHFPEPNILAHARVSDRTAPTYTNEGIADIQRRLQEGLKIQDPKTLGSGASIWGVKNGVITPLEAAQISHAKGWRNDTTGAVNKILHIEEIQSDWHQAARDIRKKEIGRLVKSGMSKEDAARQVPIDYGYQKAATKKLSGVVEEQQPSEFGFAPEYQVKWSDGTFSGGYGSPQAAARRLAEGKTDAITKGVPDSPFKDNWHELVLKRMLDDAVKNGYNKVVISPGAVQVGRYEDEFRSAVDNLSIAHRPKDVLGERISVSAEKDGEDTFYHDYEKTKDGWLSIQPIKGQRRTLEETVGKDILKKFESDANYNKTVGQGHSLSRLHDFSGDDLTIGGEGMKGFYDDIIPSYLNNYGKQWGATVGKFEIDPTGNIGNRNVSMPQPVQLHSFDITPQMREGITEKGQPLNIIPAGIGAGMLAAQQEEVPEQPEMKRGGVVGMAGGGKMGVFKALGDLFVGGAKAKLPKGQQAVLSADKSAANLERFLAESGEKRRMYHGSKEPNITGFKTRKDMTDDSMMTGHYADERDAVFVSPEPDFTKHFSQWGYTDTHHAPTTYPVYVQVKNPFDFDNPEHLKRVKETYLDMYHNPDSDLYDPHMLSSERSLDQHLFNGGVDNLPNNENNWIKIENQKFQDVLKDLGFDSFYTRERGTKNLGVYDPSNIKSAVGNRGTYDTSEPDLNKAKGGAVGMDAMRMALMNKKVQHKQVGGITRGIRKMAGAPNKTTNIIKEGGGNWFAGGVEKELEGLKRGANNQVTAVRNPATGVFEYVPAAPDPINQFIDKQLTGYIKNKMGTREDPIRLAADAFPEQKAKLLTAKQVQIDKATADMEKAQQSRGFTPEMMTRSQARIRALEKEKELIERREGLHFKPYETYNNESKLIQKRVSAGMPAKGLGQTENAKNYENTSDKGIHSSIASDWTEGSLYPEPLALNPWLHKVAPDSKVYETGAYINDLGFEHMIDELRNATNSASGLPKDLLIDPKDLSKWTMAQASEHVDKINAYRASQKAEADAVKANNAATVLHKDYPEKGMRWVELKTPESKLPEGYSMVRDYPTASNWSVVPHSDGNGYALRADNGEIGMDARGSVARKWNTPEEAKNSIQEYAAIQEPHEDELFKIVDASGNSVSVGATEKEAMRLYKRQEREGQLADALKYEGEQLQHCVGGYCPDVISGKSRIYSLRDASGKPHATVEVQPDDTPLFNKLPDELQLELHDRAHKLHPEIAGGGWPYDNADAYGTTINALMREPKYQDILQNAPPDNQMIAQIKGPRNAAPSKENLPYIQDFVRSGNYSDVRDLHNTGLVKTSPEVIEHYTKQGKTAPAYMTEGEHAEASNAALDNFLQSKINPQEPEGGMKDGGVAHLQGGGLDRPLTMNPNIAAQGKEIRFRKEIAATPWYLEFLKQYGEAPDLSRSADYDYRKAWEAGIRPERNPYDGNRYHWPSSTPSGEMLKSATHPTAWKEHYMQATGVDPDSVGVTQEDWIKSNLPTQSLPKLNDGMKRGGVVNMAPGGVLNKIFNVLSTAEREANLQKFRELSKAPMRLYHGTTATEGGKGEEAIRILKPSKEGALGSGAYLTPNPKFAGEYSFPKDISDAARASIQAGIDNKELFRRGSGNILPVYAQLKNPLILEGIKSPGAMYSGDPMVEALKKLGMDEGKASNMVEKAYENRGYIGKQVQSRAQAQGYDGIMQYRDGELMEVLPFSSNQVKSAIGNEGTYDISRPELNKAKGGSVNMDAMRLALMNKQIRK